MDHTYSIAIIFKGLFIMHTVLRNITFLIAVAITPYTQAKIYSWVDDNGKTHFSDRANAENVSEVDVQVSSSDLTLGVQERKTQQPKEKSKRKKTQTSNNRNNEGKKMDLDHQPLPPNGEMPNTKENE